MRNYLFGSAPFYSIVRPRSYICISVNSAVPGSWHPLFSCPWTPECPSLLQPGLCWANQLEPRFSGARPRVPPHAICHFHSFVL